MPSRSPLRSLCLPRFGGADAGGFIANRTGVSVHSSPLFFGDSFDTGGGGVAFDSATGTDVRGTFSSTAELLGDFSRFFEITTSVDVFSDSATGQAGGTTVEEFTYNGLTSASFTIDLTISNSVINNPVSNPSAFAGHYGSVYVGITSLFDFDEAAFCLGECWSPDDSATVEITGNLTQMGSSITFDVNPGDVFVVLAVVGTDMFGSGDASATFGVGFSAGPTSDLVTSSGVVSVIPEPSSMGLLASLCVLGALARRRRL